MLSRGNFNILRVDNVIILFKYTVTYYFKQYITVLLEEINIILYSIIKSLAGLLSSYILEVLFKLNLPFFLLTTTEL